RGVILPFPGGIVRSGSKVGAKHYAKMIASTNDAYCPTLRGRADVASALPEGVNAVLEIVVDGRERGAIERALRAGSAGGARRGGQRGGVASGRHRDQRRQLRRQARQAPFSSAADRELTVRILVYEYASGGGLAGRDVPASLSREGAAMRAALVHDLAAMRCHHIVTTADAGVRPVLPPGVEVAVVPAGDRAREAALDRLIAAADAVWLIAPESDRCLERLAARVERQGKALLGPGSAAIA